MGTEHEAELFRKYRIISINNVSFPVEPPPFSPKFRDAPNLLVLFFDDVEAEFPHAMTEDDVEKIVTFIRSSNPRPLLIHCMAGISRSGAIGKALNRYFNVKNPKAFRQFSIDNPDIVPNKHVYKILMQGLARRDAF